MLLGFGLMGRGVLMVAAGCLVAAVGGCANQHVFYQGYSRTAIVSADGRRLIVGPYGLACGDKVTAVARESRTRVALFVRYVPGGHACGPGEGALAIVPAQLIRLRSPLGHRMLVDGKTGVATPWLSARLILRPRVIPVGYRSTGVLPWMSSSLDKGSARNAACMQIYQVRNGSEQFGIVQSAAGLRLQRGRGWRPVLVRGHPGRAAAGMITWREHGLTDLIWAIGRLTASRLIAIANSAPA